MRRRTTRPRGATPRNPVSAPGHGVPAGPAVARPSRARIPSGSVGPVLSSPSPASHASPASPAPPGAPPLRRGRSKGFRNPSGGRCTPGAPAPSIRASNSPPQLGEFVADGGLQIVVVRGPGEPGDAGGGDRHDARWARSAARREAGRPARSTSRRSGRRAAPARSDPSSGKAARRASACSIRVRRPARRGACSTPPPAALRARFRGPRWTARSTTPRAACRARRPVRAARSRPPVTSGTRGQASPARLPRTPRNPASPVRRGERGTTCRAAVSRFRSGKRSGPATGSGWSPAACSAPVTSQRSTGISCAHAASGASAHTPADGEQERKQSSSNRALHRVFPRVAVIRVAVWPSSAGGQSPDGSTWGLSSHDAHPTSLA